MALLERLRAQVVPPEGLPPPPADQIMLSEGMVGAIVVGSMVLMTLGLWVVLRMGRRRGTYAGHATESH